MSTPKYTKAILGTEFGTVAATAWVIMGIGDKGQVTAPKKEGSGSLNPERVLELMESGRQVGQSLNKKLLEILKEDEKH